MIKEQVDLLQHKITVSNNKLLLHRVEAAEECSEACLVEAVNKPYNNNHKVVVFYQLLNH
jgi:hypothetical protein